MNPEQVKKQLLSQLEKLPHEQVASLKQKIIDANDEELARFISGARKDNPGECIFCKIARGEIPSVKIWEDEKHLAILDVNPNTEGMTLVLTKEHYDSDATDMPEKDYCNLMLAAKKVAKLLEKSLKVKRVAIVTEGLGVNHVHIKLYPIHGLEEKFKETWAKDRVYFKKYEGYISTQLGPNKDIEELKKIAKKITKNLPEDKGSEEAEEKVEWEIGERTP